MPHTGLDRFLVCLSFDLSIFKLMCNMLYDKIKFTYNLSFIVSRSFFQTLFLCLLCQPSNPFSLTLFGFQTFERNLICVSQWDTGQCVVTVVLPCLQSGSCPGCKNVCPWSAPGCAARSSSGSSPTPFSSSPPPSTKNNHHSRLFLFLNLHLEEPAGKITKKTNQYLMIFSCMPALPQFPVLIQLWVQAGGWEGCAQAQGQHH